MHERTEVLSQRLEETSDARLDDEASEGTLIDLAADLGLTTRDPFQIRLSVNDLIVQLRHERDAARRDMEATRLRLRSALRALNEQIDWPETLRDVGDDEARFAAPLP